jgi:hypothetical protein
MERKRLFFSFNTQLLFLEVKHDFVIGRVWTHDKPIVCVRINKINNQVKILTLWSSYI